MIVEFDNSFKKDLSKIKDDLLKKRVANVIFQVEDAENLTEINNLKKMKGYKTYYRIKMGDYRIGFELQGKNTVYFLAFAHRKDIYKIFP